MAGALCRLRLTAIWEGQLVTSFPAIWAHHVFESDQHCQHHHYRHILFTASLAVALADRHALGLPKKMRASGAGG